MWFHVIIGFIEQLHVNFKSKNNQIPMLFLAEGKLGLQGSQKWAILGLWTERRKR